MRALFRELTTQDSEVAAPTDDEIKKEYEANPAAYTAPEYRSVAIMKVEPADIAAKVSLTDQDIAAGYEKYKTEYFTPEKRTLLQLSFPTLEEAQAAGQKLAAGTDFLALAKERGFSEQDVTFADKAKTDLLDAAIADAAFSLPEGQVSKPVKGALATVLLKTVKITPEHQQTLDEVKPKLTERLQLERANDEIQSIYDAVEDARAAQTPLRGHRRQGRHSLPARPRGRCPGQGQGRQGRCPAPRAGSSAGRLQQRCWRGERRDLAGQWLCLV